MLISTKLILTGFLIIFSLNIQAKDKGEGIPCVMAQGSSPDSKEMPVTVIPAAENSTGPAFFLISGDGGWTDFDNSFCESLAKKGIPVVGLDAKKYFWKAKTPEETTSAMVQIIEDYTKKWNKQDFVLAGYSFGADIIPFIANRLPDSLKNRVKLILLLSPDRYGDFEIHLTDMLSLGIAKKRYNIVNEVKNIKNLHVAALFGQDEEEVNIKVFRETGIKIHLLPGDHHYDKNIPGLTEAIIKAISE